MTLPGGGRAGSNMPPCVCTWCAGWVQQVLVVLQPPSRLSYAAMLTAGCLVPAGWLSGCLPAGDEDERHLAELGPGSMIEVSKVAGAG